jgi:hypothetical protein
MQATGVHQHVHEAAVITLKQKQGDIARHKKHDRAVKVIKTVLQDDGECSIPIFQQGCATNPAFCSNATLLLSPAVQQFKTSLKQTRLRTTMCIQHVAMQPTSRFHACVWLFMHTPDQPKPAC